MIYGYVAEGILNKIKEKPMIEQIDSILNKYATVDIVKDDFRSGYYTDSQLINLLKSAHIGDTIVVDSIDRLAFSYEAFRQIISFAKRREITIDIMDTHEALYNVKMEAIMIVEHKSSSLSFIEEELEELINLEKITNAHLKVNRMSWFNGWKEGKSEPN